ncbi:MAG: RsmE family RNA methyltransferase [Spirochaetes bacterium]|jgi:RsmE family RNA methyltransferase|nr:RsmE family RNA methyltransferase [Spirochaetota bacterium]
MNLILLERGELGRPLPYNDRRARHVREVLRAALGDTLAVGIVEGPRGEAAILDHSAETGLVLGELRVLAEDPGAGSPDRLHPVSLLLGHVRPIVMKRLLKDLTTLGLERVLVFPGELGEKSYLSSTMWRDGTVRRQLLDGAAQAGVTCLPTIERHHTLRRALDAVELASSGGPTSLRLLCAPSGSDTLAQPQLRGGEVMLAVGPERGFTAAEERLLTDAGFAPVSLGERILRTETAALLATGLAIRMLPEA